MYSGTITGKLCPCCKKRLKEQIGYKSSFWRCELCEKDVCAGCFKTSSFDFEGEYSGDYGMRACDDCWHIYEYEFKEKAEALRIKFDKEMRELRKQCQKKCKEST